MLTEKQRLKKQEETRYYLSSLAEDAHIFNRLIRNHWSIENQLHWHLDVSFREDQSRVRKDHGPENMALLRKTALQILKQVEDKQSIKVEEKWPVGMMNIYSISSKLPIFDAINLEKIRRYYSFYIISYWDYSLSFYLYKSL